MCLAHLEPFHVGGEWEKEKEKKKQHTGDLKMHLTCFKPQVGSGKKNTEKTKKKTYWGPENMSDVFWAPGLVVSEKKKTNKEKRKKMSYLMLVVKNWPLGLVFWARVGSGLFFWVRKKELTPPSYISSKEGVSVVVGKEKKK